LFPATIELFGLRFTIVLLRSYLMNGVPETRRGQYIKYQQDSQHRLR
jgi:hypothetical protein